MFDAPQLYVNSFNQIITSFYQPQSQSFLLPVVPPSNEVQYSLPLSNSVSLLQTNMSENLSIVNSNVSLNPSPTLNHTASNNRDDEISDADMSCEEEDDSLKNPYVQIINSKVLKDRPPNWRSLVLFSGRIDDTELLENCPRPQSDNGSILPQFIPIIKRLLNPDGTLRTLSNPPLTMKISIQQNYSQETPKSTQSKGYISANGLVWSKKKPESPVKAKSATTFSTPSTVRKRFANQSLIIAGGKRIRTDNSNECIPFAQNGKCTAGGLCTFEHDGNSDHYNQQFCKSQMLGTCRKGDDCKEGPHALAKHQLPVCQYYLNMSCVKEDRCPYLHIKHNDKLENCISFQRGTCLLGLKCLRPHRFNPRIVASKCSRVSAVSNSPVVDDGSRPSTSTSNQNNELPSWNF